MTNSRLCLAISALTSSLWETSRKSEAASSRAPRSCATADHVAENPGNLTSRTAL